MADDLRDEPVATSLFPLPLPSPVPPWLAIGRVVRSKPYTVSEVPFEGPAVIRKHGTYGVLVRTQDGLEVWRDPADLVPAEEAKPPAERPSEAPLVPVCNECLGIEQDNHYSHAACSRCGREPKDRHHLHHFVRHPNEAQLDHCCPGCRGNGSHDGMSNGKVLKGPPCEVCKGSGRVFCSPSPDLRDRVILLESAAGFVVRRANQAPEGSSLREKIGALAEVLNREPPAPSQEAIAWVVEAARTVARTVAPSTSASVLALHNAVDNYDAGVPPAQRPNEVKPDYPSCYRCDPRNVRYGGSYLCNAHQAEEDAQRTNEPKPAEDMRHYCMTLMEDAFRWSRGALISHETSAALVSAMQLLLTDGPISKEAFLELRCTLTKGGFEVAPPAQRPDKAVLEGDDWVSSDVTKLTAKAREEGRLLGRGQAIAECITRLGRGGVNRDGTLMTPHEMLLEVLRAEPEAP